MLEEALGSYAIGEFTPVSQWLSVAPVGDVSFVEQDSLASSWTEAGRTTRDWVEEERLI